ncbi:S24 family peptidase [uncultured Solobacterium sp.]|uniref:LexA family protein n=1 Tax=uncultured Solobacterium sp. TaxID=747375 RepID=UPI0025DB1036|nr:S24 family peptidase [uncultured Solobacterium sp.]
MTIQNLIKNRRKELGLTLLDIANACGVSEATVSRWESGDIVNMKRSRIAQLAKVLNVSPSLLIHDDYDVLINYNSTTKPQIPVLGVVPCGEPIEAIEDIIEWIDVVPSQATGHFGLIAKGDSMAPYILDGDILIVKHSPVVASGKIAIVKVNGDEATCKRLIINDAGITLMPYNPTFQPMIFSPQDVEDKPVIIIGEVVEIRRRFK